jgi:pheromone shutdown protein TraB
MSKNTGKNIDNESVENEDVEETEPDGDIYIVPTSHVSENSSKLVHDVVEDVESDLIAVELDDKRFKKLISNEVVEDASLKDLITKSDIGIKGSLMLVLFSRFQSTIAEKLGIDIIGMDMLAGYEESSKRDIPLALVDQDMQITFKRFTSEVTITELIKTIGSFGLGYAQISRKSKDELTKQVSSENIDISEALHHIDNIFPTFKKVFIDERNDVITSKTSDIAKKFDKTVLIIGAAHEPGVVDIFEQEYDDVQVKKLPNLDENDKEYTDNKKDLEDGDE